jgi:hypothetical protein
MKKSIFLFIVISLIFSCKSNKKEQAQESLLTPVTQAEIIEDSTDLYIMSVKYPVVPIDKEGKIKEYIDYKVSKIKEEWKTGGEIYKDEVEQRKIFPTREDIRYGFYINFEEYNSVKYKTVTYLFNVFTYTGGVNGDTDISTFTFNDKGELLDIADILDLNNNNDIAITKLVADEALKDSIFDKGMLYDGLGLSYLKSDGFFFASNLQNFIIGDYYITFIFDRFQIAAGAVGTPKIIVSWDKLKPYLIFKLKS